ncbi:MAG: hypothetical protein ACI8P0_004446 [Planctomycetaceae bacterium]|jgi:hypothetical protein
MCLSNRDQTVGWADDRSPTNSLVSRNCGTRSSAHPTAWLKAGSYLNSFLSASLVRHDEEQAEEAVGGAFVEEEFAGVDGVTHCWVQARQD